MTSAMSDQDPPKTVPMASGPSRCSSLSPHHIDILLSMDLDGPWMVDSEVARMGGFTRGISRGTVKRLKSLGYIDTLAQPVPGHENDWRETGHYWVLIRKVKEVEPTVEEMARHLSDVAQQMARCGKLLKLLATNGGIHHGEEMLGAARLAKSWARDLCKTNANCPPVGEKE